MHLTWKILSRLYSHLARERCTIVWRYVLSWQKSLKPKCRQNGCLQISGRKIPSSLPAMHHYLRWLCLALHAIHCSYGQSTSNLVAHWSMDNYDENILYPDFPPGSEWQVDISDHENSEIFRSGINGSALYLKQEELILKKNIKRICVHHLDLCEDGLSIVFWIKIDQLNPDEFQAFLRTTTLKKNLPGIFIGASESNDEIDVVMWAVEAGKYRASFPSNLLGRFIWSHLAIVWTKDELIKVAVNGTFLQSDQYVIPPEVLKNSSLPVTFTDLLAGNSVGPEIHIDDMWIYYRNVSELEVSDLFEGMLPTPTSASETSTSATSASATTTRETTPLTTTETVLTTATKTTVSSTTDATTTITTTTTGKDATTTSGTSTPQSSTTPLQTTKTGAVTTNVVEPVTDSTTKSIAATSKKAETTSTAESINSGTTKAKLTTTQTQTSSKTQSTNSETTRAQQKPATTVGDTPSPDTKTTSTVSTTEGIPIWIPLTVAGSAVAIVLVCSVCVAVCCWRKRRKKRFA